MSLRRFFLTRTRVVLPKSAKPTGLPSNPLTADEARRFVNMERGLTRIHTEIHLGLALAELRGETPAADDTERDARARRAVAILTKVVAP
jgi:hypothetical protein